VNNFHYPKEEDPLDQTEISFNITGDEATEEFFDDHEHNNIDDEQFYESTDSTYDSLFLNKSAYGHPDELKTNDFLINNLDQEQREKIEKLKNFRHQAFGSTPETLDIPEKIEVIEVMEPDITEIISDDLEPEALTAIPLKKESHAGHDKNVIAHEDVNIEQLEEVEQVLEESHGIEKLEEFAEAKARSMTKTGPIIQEIGSVRHDKTIVSMQAKSTDSQPIQSPSIQQTISSVSPPQSSSAPSTSMFNSSASTHHSPNMHSSIHQKSSISGTAGMHLKNSVIGTISTPQINSRVMFQIAFLFITVILFIAFASWIFTASGSSSYLNCAVQTTTPNIVEFTPILTFTGFVESEKIYLHAPRSGKILEKNIISGTQVREEQEIAILSSFPWQKEESYSEFTRILTAWNDKLTQLNIAQARTKESSNITKYNENFQKFQSELQKKAIQGNANVMDALTEWNQTLTKNVRRLNRNEWNIYNLICETNALEMQVVQAYKKYKESIQEINIITSAKGRIQKLFHSEFVEKGQPLYMILQSNQKYITAYASPAFHQPLFDKMTNQEKLQIQIDSTTVEGKIKNIEITTENLHAKCKLHIVLDTSDMLQDGSLAIGKIAFNKSESSLIIPKTALQVVHGYNQIFYIVYTVISKGNIFQVAQKKVIPNLSDDTYVEISSGITDQDKIIIQCNQGMQNLQDGMQVTIY